MKLAYIVLAHRDPENVARMIARLVESGGFVAVHYDRKTAGADIPRLRAALGLSPNVVFVDPIDVQWGQWSIVQATLDAIEALEKTQLAFDYVHLMSGMDYPIKPPKLFENFLLRNSGREFIEVRNINKEKWVQGGLEHERYQYKHVYNWQTDRKKFDSAWKAQRARKQERTFLTGLDPYLGSQWWTLTWETCLDALRWSKQAEVRAFFETVWIPDEMFFQSYVGNNIDLKNVIDINLTFYQFDPNGIPIVYYNDHAQYLTQQNFFFARKFHPNAIGLRDAIDRYLSDPRALDNPIDKNLGRLTSEYSEFLESHRWGLADRRRVGYASDPWYGDLEWNRDHYLVVVGPSAALIERVRKIILESGAAIFHGELFGARGIEFADGVERFAGYGHQDVALRDQKPPNFLVDVIKAGAPRLTCFFLDQNMASNVRDILLWDPRAHLVIVQLDAVEAFFEEKRQAGLAGQTDAAGGRDMLDESVEFALYSRKFLAESTLHLTSVLATLTQVQDMRVRQAVTPPKEVHFVRRLSDRWEPELRRMIRRVVNLNVQKERHAPSDITRTDTVESSEKLNLLRILRLIGGISGAAERAQLLRTYFNPIEVDALEPVALDVPVPRVARYVAVFASSPAEAEIGPALKRLIPDLGYLTIVYSPAAAETAATIDAPNCAEGEPAAPTVLQRYSVTCSRYRLDDIEASDLSLLIGMIARDTHADVLWLRGDTAAASGRSLDGVSSVQPGVLDEGIDAFGRLVDTLSRKHRKAVTKINLCDDGWHVGLQGFVETLAAQSLKAGLDDEQLADLIRELLPSDGQSPT
ncbi:MAG: beta-1,6-N-acetylglucosaminyltransferase [Alphaproteobacteria bacterium]|nr:beta-1,6-N-acetylglucosaminyltransferase [Alphaproteobacteria bacterium]